MGLIIPLIGVLSLIFRIWLCEFKLKDELQFRKRYVSRILSYYFFILMIFNFKSSILNFILSASIPMMIISLIGYDFLFYYKFKSRTYWKKNHRWLIIERATIHIPAIIGGLIFYFSDFWDFAIGANDFIVIPSLILGFGPFFLLDRRWTKKYIWPRGKEILIGALVSNIVLGIILIVV